jgi:succinyl-diaminopimelate desuccinylase
MMTFDDAAPARKNHEVEGAGAGAAEKNYEAEGAGVACAAGAGAPAAGTCPPEIAAYIEEVWPEVIHMIGDLVAIDTVENLVAAAPGAPFGPGVAAGLEKALAWAERLGLEPHNLEGYVGWADVPGVKEQPLALIGHIDVVPAGLGWDTPAYGLTQREGYLLGRGVIDDKGPLALAFFAAHYFARRVAATGEPLPRRLRVIAGCNEETGMADIPPYLEDQGEPAFLFTPDDDFPVICGEKGVLHVRVAGMQGAEPHIVRLEAGEAANAVPGLAKALVQVPEGLTPVAVPGITLEPADVPGMVWVHAHGVAGHASMPQTAVNALGLLADYLLLAGLVTGHEAALMEFVVDACDASDGHALGIAASDDKFGPLTCVMSVARAGGGAFDATLDIRYPTATTAARVVAGIATHAKAAGLAIEVLGDKPPFYIDPATPEIKTLVDTYNEHTGEAAEAFTIGGGTYARKFARGCAFGPELAGVATPEWVGTMHGANEGVSEAQLKQALGIYIHAIERLLALPLE